MIRTVAFSCVLLFLSGCARMVRIEQNSSDTKAEVAKLREELGTLSKSVDDLNIQTGGSTSKMRADLTIMLKELGTQLDRLAAELDESQYRLREMEKKVDLLRGQKLLISNSKSDTTKVVTSGANTIVDTSGTQSSVKVLEAFDVEKVYNQAREDFLQGKLDLAISGFRTVYEKDPSGGTYKENALYWMGECHFKKKEWDKAVEYYNRIASEYPSGTKKCSALFKGGLSFQNLSQIDNQKSAWEQLQKVCPGSNEASRASAILAGNQE